MWVSHSFSLLYHISFFMYLSGRFLAFICYLGILWLCFLCHLLLAFTLKVNLDTVQVMPPTMEPLLFQHEIGYQLPRIESCVRSFIILKVLRLRPFISVFYYYYYYYYFLWYLNPGLFFFWVCPFELHQLASSIVHLLNHVEPSSLRDTMQAMKFARSWNYYFQ